MDKSKKPIIYSNDLSYPDNIDYENSDFITEEVRQEYLNNKKKTIIDIRIDACIKNDNKFLDFSNLKLDNTTLEKLIKISKIHNILNKITILNISNNSLTDIKFLDKYKNISIIDISDNKLEGEIISEQFEEILCSNNKFTRIVSNRLERLIANNNIINFINIPCATSLHINNNKLEFLPKMDKLNYCECIDNEIQVIGALDNLDELHISHNKLVELNNSMKKIKSINCIKNSINKISYYPSLNSIYTDAHSISKKYKIKQALLTNNSYLITFDLKE